MGCLLLFLDFSFSASRFPLLNFLSRVLSHQFVCQFHHPAFVDSVFFFLYLIFYILSFVSSSTHLAYSSRVLGLSFLSPLVLSSRRNLLARHCHFHLELYLALFWSLFSVSFDLLSKYSSSPSTHPIAFFEPIGAAV